MDEILLCYLYKYKFVIKYWIRIDPHQNKCRTDLFNYHNVYILLVDSIYYQTHRFYDETAILELQQ